MLRYLVSSEAELGHHFRERGAHLGGHKGARHTGGQRSYAEKNEFLRIARQLIRSFSLHVDVAVLLRKFGCQI